MQIIRELVFKLLLSWTKFDNKGWFSEEEMGEFSKHHSVCNYALAVCPKRPSELDFPQWLVYTLYFGRAGGNCNLYRIDVKNGRTRRGDMAKTPVHDRWRDHHPNIKKARLDDPKVEKKYHDLVAVERANPTWKLYINVLAPDTNLPDQERKDMLVDTHMLESLCIWLYHRMFGKSTLMNVAHDSTRSNAKPNSLSTIIKSTSGQLPE